MDNIKDPIAPQPIPQHDASAHKASIDAESTESGSSEQGLTEPGSIEPNKNQDDLIRPAAFVPATGKVEKQRLRINPTTIAVSALLLISALVVWFLFTAKSVYIATTPANAELNVSGGLAFKLADHYLLRKGEYKVTIEAVGYYPFAEPLAVGEPQNQDYQFTLQKLPGHLTVNASPAETADIWIDNEKLGQSGNIIDGIAAGEHQLRVDSPRYRIHEQAITIEGKDTHQQLAVTLTPAWANIGFATDPIGAELLVDGDVAGTSPVTAELLEGERQLMLKLPGYKAWQETLEIRAGEDFQLPSIHLEKADGLVMLNSNPKGASVTLNGKYQGSTPLELALAPGKGYQVTLFKDGFKPAHKNFTVNSDEELQLAIKLDAQLGDININSTHGDALLYIDGRLMGRANQKLTLPARQHKVTVKKDGYVDYSTVVLPRPGFAQVVNVKLKTLEQAKWENIKPIITATNGPQLKLFKVNAKFTMGASRREQGRRSNETLRKVELTRAFYLGIKEVTNAEFRQFEKFYSSGHVKGNSLNGENYPVVNVTWQKAALYCNWLSEQEKLPLFYELTDDLVSGFNPQANGYRLPTEAEWAWAARHQKGGVMLKYPWGKNLPPEAKSGNYGDRTAAPLLGNIQAEYNDSYAVTAPSGSFPANEKGLYDMGGNATEWLNDFYGVQTGLSRERKTDPLGPGKGDHHVIRGSSWAHGTVTDLRLSFRDYGAEGRNDLGFRIARYVD